MDSATKEQLIATIEQANLALQALLDEEERQQADIVEEDYPILGLLGDHMKDRYELIYGERFTFADLVAEITAIVDRRLALIPPAAQQPAFQGPVTFVERPPTTEANDGWSVPPGEGPGKVIAMVGGRPL